jgi:hypothetical protein
VVGTVVSDTSDAAVTDAITVTLRVTESVIVGNGIDNSTATATLRDARGIPVTGKQVSFSHTAGDWQPTVDNGDGTYTAQFTGSVGSYYTGFVTGVVVNGVEHDTPDIELEFFPVNNGRIDFESGTGGNGWNMRQLEPTIGFAQGAWLSGIGNGMDTRPDQQATGVVSNNGIIAIRANYSGGYIRGISIYYVSGNVSHLGSVTGGTLVGWAPVAPGNYRVGYVKGDGIDITRIEFDNI